MVESRPLVVVKGAGDLATGVGIRLRRVGFRVIMTEIARPTPVRRTVAFAEAVYDGSVLVEDVQAVLVQNPEEALKAVSAGLVAVVPTSA